MLLYTETKKEDEQGLRIWYFLIDKEILIYEAYFCLCCGCTINDQEALENANILCVVGDDIAEY